MKFRGRLGVRGEAEKFIGLSDDEGHGDTSGETAGHGIGDEFDQRAHAAEAHQHENDAGHHGRDQEAVEAVLARNQEHDGHKGGGRPGDLDAAAAEQGHHDPADDGGENADGRRRQRGGEAGRDARDAEGEREGQRDEADGDAGECVGRGLGPGVARAQAAEDPGFEFQERENRGVAEKGGKLHRST
jgi:hypothetical protein